ncbi:hypothetical protein [Cohaesibacter sp. ES.047]|uniref:hypothetical protein n=1 Tax=Cohaesibacter sp. ES.047 TaxID=1798205 RepID=UPI0012FE0951|nr:hypothetical protein [Cohaesibacter sp. ES.047]
MLDILNDWFEPEATDAAIYMNSRSPQKLCQAYRMICQVNFENDVSNFSVFRQPIKKALT